MLLPPPGSVPERRHFYKGRHLVPQSPHPKLLRTLPSGANHRFSSINLLMFEDLCYYSWFSFHLVFKCSFSSILKPCPYRLLSLLTPSSFFSSSYFAVKNKMVCGLRRVIFLGRSPPVLPSKWSESLFLPVPTAGTQTRSGQCGAARRVRLRVTFVISSLRSACLLLPFIAQGRCASRDVACADLAGEWGLVQYHPSLAVDFRQT